MSEKHVVLGSGQIGTGLSRLLRERGHEVVSVRRSAPKGGAEGVRVVAGDVADPAFAAEVAKGATVFYHVMNPAYHRWHAELPQLTEGVLVAAKSSGARLVVLDNLYMFGRMGGAPMKEPARKGSAWAIRPCLTRLPMGPTSSAGFRRLFDPTMRELVEMRYQWLEPYVLDDQKIRAAFGVTPTPFDEQVRATADWAREKYGPEGRRAAA